MTPNTGKRLSSRQTLYIFILIFHHEQRQAENVVDRALSKRHVFICQIDYNKESIKRGT